MVQKSLKGPKMTEIVKIALSLEFLCTKRLLFRGPMGPGDCICTCLFADVSEGKGEHGTDKWVVI